MAEMTLLVFGVGVVAGGCVVWAWRALWGPPCGPYTRERFQIEAWFRDRRRQDQAREYDGFYFS